MKINLHEYMTKKLVTVPKGSSVGEAHRLMVNYWIRHLPVIDESNDYIIGMISERDVLSAKDKDVLVEDIMSTPLKVFDRDTPIRQVVEAMIEEKRSCYLITDNDDVIGIITTEDMLYLLDHVLKSEEHDDFSLSEFITNPGFQRAAYLVGQTGV